MSKFHSVWRMVTLCTIAVTEQFVIIFPLSSRQSHRRVHVVSLLYKLCFCLPVDHSSSTGRHSASDDDDDDGGDGDGSRQRRIESTEPSVGHIAGAVVSVLLIIAIILVIVSLLPVWINTYSHSWFERKDIDAVWVTDGSRLSNWGQPSPSLSLPLPSPCPPSRPLLSPSLSLSLPCPFLTLKVGPLNTAMGLESSVSCPSGVCGRAPEPQWKSNLVHFSLKILHLLAPVLLLFLRINWPQCMPWPDWLPLDLPLVWVQEGHLGSGWKWQISLRRGLWVADCL